MKLAMVSHVAPLPSVAGQRQRVRYTLEALRHRFEVTLVTSRSNLDAIPEIVDHADRVVTVGAASVPTARRVVDRLFDSVGALSSGLKRSNLEINRLFAPDALGSVLDPADYDLAFFHYWHAADALSLFQDAGTPCVLDMHDILWRARASQLEETALVPSWFVARQRDRYRAREEAAWGRFDGVIAINEAERDEVAGLLGSGTGLWYAPMGVDLDRWPDGHEPDERPRVAFYGGLSTPARELAAAQCAEEIMPLVWERHPDCELWIVGANPTDRVRRLGDRPRVTVTGFVEDAAAVLGSMWAVLCPFSGQFGFRSRLIEVLACGVPIVATSDAVHGMGLDSDDGSILLGDDSAALAAGCVELLADRGDRLARGRRARAQAERFGFDATYGRMADDLAAFAARSAG